MPARDPLDELEELLAEDSPAVEGAPHVVPAMQAEPARALAEAPAAPVVGVPALSLWKQAEGFTRDLLADARAARERGELDATDVMNLLPKVHKIAVDEAKLELARTGGRVDLPTIHITIGSAGQIRAERVSSCPAEVVEVAEWAAAEKLPAATSTWLGPAGLSVDLQPIGGGGES